MKTLEQLGISPAPWTQGGDCGTGKCLSDDEVCDDVIYDTNGQMVADISTIIDSDAQLIAAAPDLYEACRRAIAWEDHVIRKKMKPPENWKVIVAAMRAALEKAGGKE